MKDPNTGIGLGIAVAHGGAVVGASVVHQNQLKIGECLLYEAGYTGGQIFFYAVNRHNNTDLWHSQSSLLCM
ncbi:hypothetical protein EVA_12321 [gut metagenome]|uniref:Uncharacterized protein n=1 Tax=gut metagenome TaxID=749906 RepID=J9GCU1_9ZZZZ